MLRMLGGALIFLGCWLAGWKAAQNRRNRVWLLQDMIEGLEKINRELSFRMTPMPRILQSAGQEVGGQAGSFFLQCGRRIELGECSLGEIWEREAASLRGKTEEQTMDIFLRLGGFLGRYDWQGEKEYLSAAIEALKGNLQQERTESQRCGRLYRTLGAAAGGVLVILLL